MSLITVRSIIDVSGRANRVVRRLVSVRHAAVVVAAIAALMTASGERAEAKVLKYVQRASPGCAAVNSGAWLVTNGGLPTYQTGEFNAGEKLTFVISYLGGSPTGLGSYVFAGSLAAGGSGGSFAGPVSFTSAAGFGSLATNNFNCGFICETPIQITAATCRPFHSRRH